MTDQERKNLQSAYDTLEYYNRWRRGEDIPMPKPKDISVAIDYTLAYMKKQLEQ